MATARHTVEPELEQPLPRRGLIWPRLGWRQLGPLLFLLPFVAAGLLVGALAIHGDAVQLLGRRIQGELVSKEEQTDSDGDPTYKAAVDFTIDGEPHHGSVTISKTQFQELGQGDPVMVKFLRLPYGNSVASDGAYAMPIFLTVFALFWDGFVFVLVGALVNQMRETFALLRCGTATVARITKKTTEQSDDSTTYSLLYEFRAEGQEQMGCDTVSSRQWNEARTDQQCTVLYFPEKPDKCRLYEFI